MDKKLLTEQDIRTKFITPALLAAGWDRDRQLREDVGLTAGRIRVRSNNMHTRDKKTILRADYVLYQQPNVPLAVVEAKDNKQPIAGGMQQALEYAALLDVPFAYSSNGDGFIEHDRTQAHGVIEREIGLADFPSPEELWRRYCRYKGIETPTQTKLVSQPYYQSPTSFEPRYYQTVAINRVVEAVAKGATRLMLVMATGTGKTQTAFQIIHRLWKAGAKKRILFLADRNVLLEQPFNKDFVPFGKAMTWVKSHHIDTAYEVYLALYQGLTSKDPNPDAQAYREFSPSFFDLIVVDECHRGSAKVDSAWRAVLDYFPTATHLGLTATPNEEAERSNTEYFGKAIYTYSLKQGIADGFLAPYKVVRVQLDRDEGWRPEQGHTDANGELVPDREYNRTDYDRTLVLGKRTEAVARRVTEFLKASGDRMAKTIVFCQDREHAGRMRSALVNFNAGMVQTHPNYVMQLTGGQPNIEGLVEDFTNPKKPVPVIATTSQLLTTGVDTKTVKVIVLDAPIASLTQFKQIIGRGTRIDEDQNKAFFTILDFRHSTKHFADPKFDGEPDEETDVLPGQPIEPDGNNGNVGQLPDSAGQQPGAPGDGDDSELGPQGKIYVNDVPVDILRERQLYYTADGKLITESLQDYTRQQLRGKYAELDAFIARWRVADTVHELRDELEQQGLLLDELRTEVSMPDLDLFDLLCHVAYDAPPRTRRERAEQVRRRDYFTRFGEQAREVLGLLLDKYAQDGPDDLDTSKVLELAPFDTLDTPSRLVKRFGGASQFRTALRELRAEIYEAA